MHSKSISDENELLAKMKQGDKLAFEIIYHRYKALLYVHISKYLDDQEEAKDIIHDIFLNLWQNRESIQIQVNLVSYLYQSARNRVINLQIKGSHKEKYINSFQSFLSRCQSGTDYLVREKILLELIEQEIACLPERMRHVFELSRKEGLSHKEIAKQLRINEQSVRSHVKGALKILRLKFGIIILFIILGVTSL